MDFFKQQDIARRKTGILLVYFVLALLFIVVAVNGVVFFAFTPGDDYVLELQQWIDNVYWEHPTAAVVLIILYGSGWRHMKLIDGGKAVAEMVGATEVSLDSNDTAIKRYINVVEELSLASGVPMPSLYVLKREQGINAFVAGYTPTESVMVVTQGTLDTLSRDELQGVVGHEFSHILNGDMRINVRLIVVLAGILAIGQFGRFLLRSSRDTDVRQVGILLPVGLALLIIGYIGLFFGRLIKAAISRQREYLADASSVQFTRNPRGIAGALYKIQQTVNGSFINPRHAEDMSHMCFGKTMNFYFESLLASHPPIPDRIRAIDPSFLNLMHAKDIISRQNNRKSDEVVSSFVNAGQYSATAEQLTASVGNPNVEHIAYGVALHDAIQLLVQDKFHTTKGAKAIIYALLVQQTEKDPALVLLSQHESEDLILIVNDLLKQFVHLDKRQRLPLIDLTIPALKKLEEQEASLFINQLEALIKSDVRFTLFEFVLLTIIRKHLSANAGQVARVKFSTFHPVRDDIHRVLLLLVKSSGQNKDKNHQNLRRALLSYGIDVFVDIETWKVNVSEVEASLQRLAELSPLLKRNLINTCAELVIEDGIVMAAEAELLRAIAESLDCPMPPLLPSSATRT